MKGRIQNKPAFRLAFCAAVAGLEVVMMLAAGLIRVGTYAAPCFAGMLTTAVVIEYRCKWALGVYVTASVLSFFLTADKEAALLFVLLFGYYPIFKNVIERRIAAPFPRWFLKFAVFNAAAVASFYIAALLLGVPASEYTLFGVYLPHVFLLAGNAFFVLYDLSVNAFVRLYVQRLRRVFFH